MVKLPAIMEDYGVTHEDIVMTQAALDRMTVVQRCLDQIITQIDAAKVLGISERHLRRIAK